MSNSTFVAEPRAGRRRLHHDGASRDALLLANVRDCVIVTDMDGIVTYWNAGATRILGWTAQEMVGTPLVNRFPEEVRAHVAALTADIVRGHPWQGEFEDYRKDGSRVWLDARVDVIRDEDGRPAGVMGISHDVSARRLAEIERDQVIEQLRLHVSSLPLAYIGLDRNLRVVEWNAAAERTFGYAKAEVLGMEPPFTEILPASEGHGVVEALTHIKAQTTSQSVVNDNVTKDGRRITCEWHNTPLIDESGAFVGMVSLAQDITGRRQLEEQLQQAQKMEAVGQLAGGVAHDFNNVLTLVNGYSELLLDNLEHDPASRELVEEIRRAGERAEALTRQLLAFSRKQVLAPRLLDVNAVVRDSEKMLRRLIGEDIELTTVLQPSLRCTKADPGQLEQALLNLAVNARDAMPRGGTLRVETASLNVGKDATGHPGVPAGEYVQLSVRDSGTGMSEDVRRRLFEPFFTTKGLGKGTGLGLAVVHGFVKQNGGHITVESEPGQGTCFRLYLPVREGKPRLQDRGEDAATTLPRGTGTILLVEDEAQVRALAQRTLESCGYTVLEASRGDEALAIAREQHDGIDLLVTDVVIPGRGGRLIADELSAINPAMKIMFVSGYTDDAVVRHGVLHDQVNFLQKPFTPSMLAQKVHEVLAH